MSDYKYTFGGQSFLFLKSLFFGFYSCKCYNLSSSFNLLQREFSSYPDLAAYHCIAVTLGQAGLMKELFDIIDCMRALPPKNFKTGMLEKWDPRLEPDAVVYNAVS